MRATVLALPSRCSSPWPGAPATRRAQPQAGDTRFVAGRREDAACSRPPTARPPRRSRGTTLDGGTATSPPTRARSSCSTSGRSWCAPCRAEAPVLKDVAAKTKADGVEFLGIDFKDRKADALAFERSHRSRLPEHLRPAGQGRALLPGHGPARGHPVHADHRPAGPDRRQGARRGQVHRPARRRRPRSAMRHDARGVA